jgi:hypothetical protein
MWRMPGAGLVRKALRDKAVAHARAASRRRGWIIVVPRRAPEPPAEEPAPPPPAVSTKLTRRAMAVTVATAFGSGMFLYAAKHQTELADRELAGLYRETATVRGQTEALKAAWSQLNDPARLQTLADRYLALRPVSPAQMVALADLPARLTTDTAAASVSILGEATTAQAPGAQVAASSLRVPSLQLSVPGAPAPMPALTMRAPAARHVVLARSDPPRDLALPADQPSQPPMSAPPHALSLPAAYHARAPMTALQPPRAFAVAARPRYPFTSTHAPSSIYNGADGNAPRLPDPTPY